LAVLGVCATIGMLVFSSSSSSSEFGNADAGVKKGFLTFVTVKEMKVRGAYEEIGTIWTADLDGTKRRRLAAGNVPDISPDGRWVAFVNRANQLQVIASEGGASRLVVRKPNPYAFRWAPNSRRLGVVIGGSLVVIDIETGERVTIDRGRHVYGFSFSPSGKEIAWARKTGKLTPTLGGNDIYRASTSGGNVHRLTRTGAVPCRSGDRRSLPSLDSSRLRFSTPGSSCGSCARTGELSEESPTRTWLLSPGRATGAGYSPTRTAR